MKPQPSSNRCSVHVVALVILALAGQIRILAQGALQPDGSPKATMRTLEQVEPRTPIPISSLPFTITLPGSYYLTGNLSAFDMDAVRIRASNVSLDLMGFKIESYGALAEPGIRVEGSPTLPLRNILVRNGSISGRIGLICQHADGCLFERLFITECSDQGVYLDGTGSGQRCNENALSDCVISKNFGDGIYLNAFEGQCSGNAIRRCTFSYNQQHGIHLSGDAGLCSDNTFVDCTVKSNGYSGVQLVSGSGECSGNTVADCKIADSVQHGILLDGSSGRCSGNTLSGCSVRGSGEKGIVLVGTGGQCDGNVIRGCTVQGNTSHGINFISGNGRCSGNLIAQCAISGNKYRGVYMTGSNGDCKANVVRDCVISWNVGMGISLYRANGNRIEGNHCCLQTGATSYGISTSTCSGNVVVRNTCQGQTSNYSLSANDTYGPIVTATGALPSTGDGANPWANFSR
jgi:parallel beta-helix repeat protein